MGGVGRHHSFKQRPSQVTEPPRRPPSPTATGGAERAKHTHSPGKGEAKRKGGIVEASVQGKGRGSDERKGKVGKEGK